MSEKPPELSPRELEILRLVSRGITNQMIARQLSISENTVKVHLRNIFSKLNVESRTEATLFAISRGWVEVEDLGPPSSPEVTDGGEARRVWAPYLALALALIALVAALSVPRLIANQGSRLDVPPVTERTAGTENLGPLFPALPLTPTATKEREDRWKPLAPMPSGRWGLATATFGNRIYSIGGRDSQGVTSTVQAYDPQEGRWLSLSPKPLGACEIRAAVIGGKIYVPGGKLASGEVTSTLEIYDPEQDSWARGTPMPLPLAAYGLVSLEGRLYVVGGWDGEAYRGYLYEYDPGADRWRVRAEMPTPRAHACVGSVDGKIYVIGGTNSLGDLDICEVYDPTRDRGTTSPWARVASLPEPRSRAASAVLGRNIYIVGGRGRTLSNFRYDAGADQWLSFEAPFSGAWLDLGMEALDIQLYALGGWPEERSRSLWRYQALYRVFIL